MGWHDNYPHGGPPQYSYTRDFYEKFWRTGFEAETNLTLDAINSYNPSTNPQIIANLQALIEATRTSELNFLQQHELPNPGNNWGELIKAFTLIFQSQDVFERNLSLLSQVEAGDTKIYQEFETYFSSYIQAAAAEIIHKRNLVTVPLGPAMIKLTDDVIMLALKKGFKQSDYKIDGLMIQHADKKGKKKGQRIQAFTQLLQCIQQFRNNQFLRGISDVLNLESALQDAINLNAQGKLTAQGKVNVNSTIVRGDVKGSVKEHFERVVAGIATSQLKGTNKNFDWIASGSSGVKADVLGSTVEDVQGRVSLSLLHDTSGQDQSLRQRVIKNYKEFFNKYKNARGELVFISDKAYQIKSGFGGFTAQDSVTLNNLQALLEEVHANVDIPELINFLANCGSDMILENRHTNVMQTLATQIGYFLFDDLSIEGPAAPGINRVHLLNLSGFYVPLSVYLEGVLHALLDTQQSLSSMASISFSAPAEDAARPWKDESDWTSFRQRRLDATTLDVSFMRNFASFIAGNIIMK